MRAIGRLKPGVTPAQAAAEGTARAIAAPDAGPVAMALFGAREPIQITVTDAMEAAAADVRPAIVILLIASVLLFVTAIANVANMQLARATARHRELTIRAALGAGTGRLARQLLIENALDRRASAARWVCCWRWRCTPRCRRCCPPDSRASTRLTIDGRVLLLTLLLSVDHDASPAASCRCCTCAGSKSRARFGDGSARVGGRRTRRGWPSCAALIVASQVAVTCVLVIGAVLLARSFIAQHRRRSWLRPEQSADRRDPVPAELRPP